MSARAEAAAEQHRPRVFVALAALPDRALRRREQRPALRVVEPARRRRRNWQVGTVAGALLFVALFAIAGVQTLIVQQGRHIDDLNGRISSAEDDAERLKIELAELQSPQRIVDEAKNRLGMIEAPSPVYLRPTPIDDAKAAEVPPTTPSTTTPPTTAATTSKKATSGGSGTSSSTKGTTATTTAKASSGSGATATTSTTTRSKATTGTGVRSTTPTTVATGASR